MIRTLPVALAVCVCMAGTRASPPQQPTFRSGTEAVRLDVLVSERGRPVPGLEARDFDVRDNGVPQVIRLVERGEVPVAVSLVLDTSESVSGARLQHLLEASSALLDALGGRDRASLLVFDDAVRLLVPETATLGEVRRQLAQLRPGGRTALNDAAYAGLVGGSSGEGRRLMVLFTDGVDNESWLSRDAVLEVARRSEVVVYGIGIRDGLPPPDESDTVRRVVEALSAATGGQYVQADTDRDLERLFLRVITEFRQRYWLAYTPAGVRKGDGWHTITVRVPNRRVSVTSRSGYFSGR
jgi:VWFA-related protein